MNDSPIPETEALKKKIASQNKMLRALIARAERQNSAGMGALDKLRDNHELEHLVAKKTADLEAESAKLLETLVKLHHTQEKLVQAQKLEAIGQLAAGIAHDFNNLLTVILGNAEILTQGCLDESAMHEPAIEITRAGERASDLTRQLLAFSRKQTLSPRKLDLNNIITKEKSLLQRLIGEDVEIVTHLRADIGFIKFDPVQIEQIILNLVVNARDAMPTGGKLTIKTANVSPMNGQLGARQSVLLSFTDTGKGMDVETKSRIFEPFFTTKGPGKGTGLGLATVYGIVEQSSGSICVDSKVGQGTTFRIYLPTTDDTGTDDSRPADAPAPRPRNGNANVLLVEDEDQVRHITKAFLESGGYHVVSTKDPYEAIEICKDGSNGLELLLTDIVMPKMGGPELAREALCLLPELKILYMSGYFSAPNHQSEPAVPVDILMMKPFSMSALLNKVRETLETPSRV